MLPHWFKKRSLLLISAIILSSHADLRISPSSEVVSLPSNEHLDTFAVLVCIIDPQVYSFTTFWITPQEEYLYNSSTNPHYSITYGRILINRRTTLATTLHIKSLSYADAGPYRCVIQSTSEFDRNNQAHATVQLKLSVELTSMQDTVTANTSAKEVNLTCEMSKYIRPDKDLFWTGNNGSRLQNSEKYRISFENSSSLQAQYGRSRISPSRLSTLTIYNLNKYDNGNYSCSIQGTSLYISTSLKVMPQNTGGNTSILTYSRLVPSNNGLQINCKLSYICLSLIQVYMLIRNTSSS